MLNNNLKDYWIVTLPPLQGPYHGYTLELGIEFPANYPFACPSLSFEHPMYYPYVCGYHEYKPIRVSAYGSHGRCEICTHPLKQQWRAAMTPNDCNLYLVIEIIIDTLENAESYHSYSRDRETFRRELEQVMGPPS